MKNIFRRKILAPNEIAKKSRKTAIPSSNSMARISQSDGDGLSRKDNSPTATWIKLNITSEIIIPKTKLTHLIALEGNTTIFSEIKVPENRMAATISGK